MNEKDEWCEIYEEWREIKRVKRLNQELYDSLFGSIHYIIEYSKKYNIPIKNREQLVLMSERIHRLMDEIEPSTSDENLQGKIDDENRRRLDSTHRLNTKLCQIIQVERKPESDSEIVLGTLITSGR